MNNSILNLEHLREICLGLPGATEDIKWEKNLVFSVGEKMFCAGALTDDFGISFKVGEDDFDELTSSADVIPAPYLARAKWIKVVAPERFSHAEWNRMIKDSYLLVLQKLPKKIQEELSGKDA